MRTIKVFHPLVASIVFAPACIVPFNTEPFAARAFDRPDVADRAERA